jgi:hypothetical protein
LLNIIEDDLREYITTLPADESHYSLKTSESKFLSPEFASVSNIFRVFIDIFPEYKDSISYSKFLTTFNEYDLKIRPLRIDVCSTCDNFNFQIRAYSRINNIEKSDSIKLLKKNHLIESEKFYKKLIILKSNLKHDKTQAIISIDFQKNTPIPDTKRNLEYYLRKLNIQNFCIYDEKTFKATMFVYSEHFACKGPNEVISCLDFYVKNVLNSDVKILHLFSDNAFSQNKNRYLWTFFQYTIDIGLLNKVIIYYPIPGHSRLSCDRAFSLIEKKLKTNEKFSTHS